MSRDINELEPGTRELCVKLLQACELKQMPLVVVQTYRSFEEQEALYAKGRVRPGPVVTNARAGDSWHNYRRAFDVAFWRGGVLSWDGDWEVIGVLGEGLGLEWGGRFKSFPDRPHFQLTSGLTLAQARSRSLVVRADLPTQEVPLPEQGNA